MAFGEDFARPVNHQSSSLPSNATAEIWLLTVAGSPCFCAGCADEGGPRCLLYTPCSVCKKKLSADAVACAHAECSPSMENTLLTSVISADATGALRRVLCCVPEIEMLSFCGFGDVASLERMLE